MGRRLTNIEFIEKANITHNNEYDYSLVNYINYNTKIKIVCKKHGIFKQTPHNHLTGSKCRICVIKKRANNQIITNEEFIKKAKEIHGDNYNYSQVKYISCFKEINIICSKHGIFNQKPANHLSGRGCNRCQYENKAKLFSKSKENFIIEANNVHNFKYDYSNINYINNKLKISILCSKHNFFNQTPDVHLGGHGCPMCKQSKGEIQIMNFLKKNNINYIYQKTFNKCKNKRLLYFDFYLPNNNICIEYDGKQHYESCEFFGGVSELINTQKKDDIKNKYCSLNNILLIRIRYDDNVENKLNKLLKNYNYDNNDFTEKIR